MSDPVWTIGGIGSVVGGLALFMKPYATRWDLKQIRSDRSGDSSDSKNTSDGAKTT